MRKAFDANVSRTKPRLRLGSFTAAVDPAQDALAMVEDATARADAMEPAPATAQEKIVQHLAQAAAGAPAAPALQARVVAPQPPASVRAPEPEPVAAARVVAPEPVAAAPVAEPAPRAQRPAPAAVQPAPALDPRERREKLRERLKAATAKVEPSQPTPQSPAEARTSALSLIAQLRQELEDAQALNASMAKDLDQARADIGRAAEEARARTAEAARMSEEVAGRARLIEELGKEMASLEGERDDALVELVSSRGELEKHAAARQEIEARLAACEAELAETLTEEERLAADLEARNAELRQAQTALGAITEERDRLAKQVAELSHERVALLDSQKALDEIHRALADARVRVGGKS